jgi:hypothetical protein
MSQRRQLREPGHQATYTPGQLALLFDCAPHTVTGWFDRGWLIGHRTPHGRRRVRIEEVRRFCAKYAQSFDYVLRKLRLAEIRQNQPGRSAQPKDAPWPEAPAGRTPLPAQDRGPAPGIAEQGGAPVQTRCAPLTAKPCETAMGLPLQRLPDGKIRPQSCYSTGQVVELLEFGYRTIVRLMDNGVIKSYRMPAAHTVLPPPDRDAPNYAAYDSATCGPTTAKDASGMNISSNFVHAMVMTLCSPSSRPRRPSPSRLQPGRSRHPKTAPQHAQQPLSRLRWNTGSGNRPSRLPRRGTAPAACKPPCRTTGFDHAPRSSTPPAEAPSQGGVLRAN